MAPGPSSALLAVAEAFLERFELGFDFLLVPQFGDFLFQTPGRSAERQGVGAALGKVGMALEYVEAREGLVDLWAGIGLAHPRPLVGALQPRLDRILAGARLAQFAL